MPAPAQAPLPFDFPSPADTWIRRLSEALNDPNRRSGFLAQAESAVAACPGDGNILALAATSALLDKRPDRALVFLKRFSKRYQAVPTEYLLRALALSQSNKTVAARVLLERHELTEWRDAFQVFPAGQARFRWLAEQLDAIMGRNSAFRRRAAA